MASLAEIRAKLQEAQAKSTGQSTGGGDNAIYPHWNMQEGKEAVIRLLPDGNSNNTFFWVERAMIKLPFAGIKGETDSEHLFYLILSLQIFSENEIKQILKLINKSLTIFAKSFYLNKSKVSIN